MGDIKIEGIISTITYHNEENGFSVFKVQQQSEIHTIVGHCPYINIGENVVCYGNWHNNSNFGKQLQATSISISQPTSIDAIEKYLSSGLIHGIGPQLASELVNKFQDKIFQIIEEEPEKLLTIPGIGESRQQQILAAWDEQSVMRDAMIFLQSLGLGANRAHRIFLKYGQQTVAMVRHNPYTLCNDIAGIGFKSADNIALKLGVSTEATSRIHAGLMQVLNEQSTLGHCIVSDKNAIELTSKLLNISHDVIEMQIIGWQKLDDVKTLEIDSQTYFALKKIFKAESTIADRITKILNTSKTWVVDNFHTDFQLAESQLKAFELALSNKFTIITGGPGVGKTTILKAIIQNLMLSGVNLSLAAPTGRAAKRMHQSTGVSAKTLHRLLEYDPITSGFKKNLFDPIDSDVIIIDEASMVDVHLFAKLLEALSDTTTLIMVGDVDQLPSVGPGNILADLINSNIIATARLTEIFRQAKDSSIIINAHRVNNGLYPSMREDDGLKDFYLIHDREPKDIINKIKSMIFDRIPKRFGIEKISDIQILTPMRKGILGTENINSEMQSMLQNPNSNFIKYGQTKYFENDKVMQHQNDYDKQVFNGDIGFIKSIDTASNTLDIQFENKLVTYTQRELEHITLAYACTIHKSQGSEFPVVIIPVHMQHFVLLEKNLLYTAITRARELVILIGDNKAIFKSISTISANKRQTALQHLLKLA